MKGGQLPQDLEGEGAHQERHTERSQQEGCDVSPGHIHGQRGGPPPRTSRSRASRTRCRTSSFSLECRLAPVELFAKAIGCGPCKPVPPPRHIRPQHCGPRKQPASARPGVPAHPEYYPAVSSPGLARKLTYPTERMTTVTPIDNATWLLRQGEPSIEKVRIASPLGRGSSTACGCRLQHAQRR